MLRAHLGCTPNPRRGVVHDGVDGRVAVHAVIAIHGARVVLARGYDLVKLHGPLPFFGGAVRLHSAMSGEGGERVVRVDALVWIVRVLSVFVV